MTVAPLRLRDLRRLIARGRHTARALRVAAALGITSSPYGEDVGRVCRALDRLISVHGPDALVEPLCLAARQAAEDGQRALADRTDHTVGEDAPISDGPHTDADAATHGGDGNSGEVDRRAETAAARRAGDVSGSAPSGSAAGDTPDPQAGDHGAAADSREGGQQTGSSRSGTTAPDARGGVGDHGPDEGTGEMGTQLAARPAAADNGAAGTGAPAEGSGGDAHASTIGEATGEGVPEGEAGPGARKRATGRDAGSPRPRIVDVAIHVAASRIAAAMERLVWVAGAQSHTATPRWDGRALVRELVTRRVALHRARRPARVPRGILVTPDLSASCRWVAGLTLPLARRVAERRDLVLAPTGQGRPEGVVAYAEGRSALARAVRRLIDEHGPVYTVAHWRAMLGVGITHVLVLGDVHGHASYTAARDAGIRVLWLDPNAADMPVDDTAGMVYEAIRDATPVGVAEAFERAVRRA